MLKKIVVCFVLIISSQQVYSQCACCAGAASGSAFGDINNGMLTLERHQFGAELYGDFRVMNNGNDIGMQQEETVNEEEETLLNDMLVTSAGVRYGVSSRLMLSMQLPFTLLYTEAGNDNGLGDLVMTSTFSILKRASMNVAVIGGLELPTGEQKASAFDNTTVVLGSGSWDPMAGLAFSKRWNKVLLNASGLYKFTTNGFDGNHYGDLAVQNISLTYLFSMNSCHTGDTLSSKLISFTAGTGYYGEWLESITEEGVRDVNSGYYVGFVTANMKVSLKKWSVPFTFSLPVIRAMNGNQHDAGNRYRMGIVRTF